MLGNMFIHSCQLVDDTLILSLSHKDMDPSDVLIIKWCDTNYLILNVSKTHQMVFDPRQGTDANAACRWNLAAGRQQTARGHLQGGRGSKSTMNERTAKRSTHDEVLLW